MLNWLRSLLASPGNLLGPEIKCEVVIHIMPDWSRRVYVSKLHASPQDLANIIKSVVDTGIDIGRQHGIAVQFGGPHAPPHPEQAQAQSGPQPGGGGA